MKRLKKIRFRRWKKGNHLSFLEMKQQYWLKYPSVSAKKRWYKKNKKWLYFRFRLRKRIRFLCSLRIPFKFLSVARWLMVDFLRGKSKRFWGIYCFVALPGEGKTLSMVAHMERCIHQVGREQLYIATNFHYARQDAAIIDWVDMIRAAKFALNHGKNCILALDEIHITFDSSDWKAFPPEMLQLLSFNRKYGLQFLCSAQIYDRIPTKVRSISNYVVLCENSYGLDRHFKNYYYNTCKYEAGFNGKRKAADFIRTYVASDDLYALYDTKQQVDNMLSTAQQEKDKRQEAFDLLFRS